MSLGRMTEDLAGDASIKDLERARIAVDRHTERLRHAVGGDVTVGRPDPAGGEDIGVAMPERIECVDDRSLLIADHPYFLEINVAVRYSAI
jgi:hypothetical protein